MGKSQARALAALVILLVFGFASGASSATPQPAADLKSEVTSLLARFPANDAAERDALAAGLLKLGPAAVAQVCGRVQPPGGPDDTTARFALNALAVYVTAPGRESQRPALAKAILDATAKTPDKEVQAFLISQVQVAGGPESVKPLARYLADARLAEPAAQALLAIRAPGTAEAFLKALDTATGPAKVTAVKALGDLRSRPAVKKLVPLASSPDERLRQASLWALANIGDPAAGPVLERTRVMAGPYERGQAPALFLLYARRLAEAGSSTEAVAFCRDVLKYYTAPGESHVAASALGLIVAMLKDRALPDLLAAMDSPGPALRAAALELASAIPGSEATAKWIEKAAASRPEVRAEIVAMLGRRGDRTALPAVRESLKAPDTVVRLAAIPAAVKLGGAEVLPDILPFFHSEDAAEIAAAREALLGFEAGLVVPEAARLVGSAPPAGRAALISVLAAKGARDRIDLVLVEAASPEPVVRSAAVAALADLAGEKDLPRLLDLLVAASDSEETVNLQKAVAAAAGRNPDPERRADPLIGLMAGAPPARKAAILKVLPRVPGAAALRTVTAAAADMDPQVQAAGVYALSQWPDLKASDELLRIVASSPNRKYVLMALEGYVRLVREADLPAYKKVGLLGSAMALPKEEADRKAVLRGLAGIRGPESLRLLSGSLDRPALRDAAAQSILEMASEQAPEERWLSGQEAYAVLRRVERQATDPAEKDQAAKVIADRLRQGGFVPLSNGRDLEGWKGLVADPPARAKMSREELAEAQAAADERMRAHWTVADGALVFDGKGESLCTLRDYGDFEMLVDWKIGKAGDSGIYLRGSPQVQIWDAAANTEGSGGLYNNEKNPRKPLAKADHPVGEWNTFRIIMIGERVTVYLNDRMVADNTVLENYWERDKPIYPVGQLELQAHGNPLWFRNIFVREIPRDTAAPGLSDAERDEGFTALFNGRDLAGWTGEAKGYAAEDGKIVIHPDRGGGNLCTEKEYGDFVFRFEFKLTPAANNGVGIRAPLEGDAAYAGMEIQILEDGSPVYRDLQPYQFHGSIYGVAPARRGVLRPVGEWNTEEISVRGRRVAVTVNGTRIVDADLDKAAEGGTIDHNDHPGLKRERGHIGFLGHGSIVEFRNIRVRELK